jgi:GntR family transcriptional regulator
MSILLTNTSEVDLPKKVATKATSSPHRYVEIETWLRAKVKKGQPGTLLPAETEIAEKFSVSRMTARHAVLNLMREGLVDRKRGSGTFIAHGPMHRREGVLLSFTEDMRRRGLTPSSVLISGRIVAASKKDQSALKLKPGSKIVEIRRVRLADGIPLALERVALIEKASPVLKFNLENGSLHDALRSAGFFPTIASGWLSARNADQAESDALEIPMQTSLLVETRVIENEKGVPLEFTETAYASNRYVVDMKLTLAPAFIAPYNAAPMEPA